MSITGKDTRAVTMAVTKPATKPATKSATKSATESATESARRTTPPHKIFVPFSEALIQELGLSIGELVPFQLEYQCLRMNEAGIFEEQRSEARA